MVGTLLHAAEAQCERSSIERSRRRLAASCWRGSWSAASTAPRGVPRPTRYTEFMSVRRRTDGYLDDAVRQAKLVTMRSKPAPITEDPILKRSVALPAVNSAAFRVGLYGIETRDVDGADFELMTVMACAGPAPVVRRNLLNALYYARRIEELNPGVTTRLVPMPAEDAAGSLLNSRKRD